jgi:hypothetical protein
MGSSSDVYCPCGKLVGDRARISAYRRDEKEEMQFYLKTVYLCPEHWDWGIEALENIGERIKDDKELDKEYYNNNNNNSEDDFLCEPDIARIELSAGDATDTNNDNDNDDERFKK